MTDEDKSQRPVPSTVNYPEPSASQTINKIGFDSTGARYKVTNASPSNSGDHLIAESFFVDAQININTTIPWNETTVQTQNGDLIQAVSQTHFELQPGHMYELIALVPLKAASTTTSTGVQWQWYHGTTPLGIKGAAFADMGNWTQENDFRPSMAFITVENTPIQINVKYTSIYSGIAFRPGQYGYCTIRTIS